MKDILLLVSNLLIIIPLFSYFLFVIFYRKKITNSNGFNITKDFISEYDLINVIESKGYFTYYNIQRKVIKLSSNCYYGNSISDISLCLYEASISIIDGLKNKYINIFRKLFNNLKLLYIFPVISLVINSVSYNISDSKVSLFFIILFAVISYMNVDIKSSAWLLINKNINNVKDISENNRFKVLRFVNKLLLIDKIIFVGELVVIVRLISILMNF